MQTGWFCTDDDSLQYCKENADGTFNFIEKVWLDTCEGDKGYPDKNYVVKTGFVDLYDYTEFEKECAISSYYSDTSLDYIYRVYGSDAEQIIAECIFEDMCDGSAWTSEFMTEKEANEYIQNYISSINRDLRKLNR